MDDRGSVVAGRRDVGLDGVLGGVGRVAGGHDALVEGAGRAVAVVAADAEDDGAFLVHRVVAGDVGPRAVVEGGQSAGLGVAAADGPVVGFALDDGGDEAVADRGVVRVVAGVDSGVEAVREVGHDPGAVAGAVAPDLDVAEVDGFHGAVAVVAAVAFGVAVVEAAAAVVVGAVEDGVHAFGGVAGGDPVGVVVAVAGAGRDVDAVGLVAADRGGSGGGVGEVVVAAGGGA